MEYDTGEWGMAGDRVAGQDALIVAAKRSWRRAAAVVRGSRQARGRSDVRCQVS